MRTVLAVFLHWKVNVQLFRRECTGCCFLFTVPFLPIIYRRQVSTQFGRSFRSFVFILFAPSGGKFVKLPSTRERERVRERERAPLALELSIPLPSPPKIQPSHRWRRVFLVIVERAVFATSSSNKHDDRSKDLAGARLSRDFYLVYELFRLRNWPITTGETSK